MTKALKICLEPDCGELSDQSRCEKHRKEQEQQRGSASARGYDSNWRRLVREAVRNHLQKYGAVCPGFNVAPHTATKASLTGDHIVPLSLGGKNELTNIAVLCRACNSRKGGRNREPVANSVATSSEVVAQKRKFLIYDYNQDRGRGMW